MVGSMLASPNCSVISAAVRAASVSRGGPSANDGRSPSASDDGCGAGSSSKVAASGARAPVSRSASSMVSLCGPKRARSALSTMQALGVRRRSRQSWTDVALSYTEAAAYAALQAHAMMYQSCFVQVQGITYESCSTTAHHASRVGEAEWGARVAVVGVAAQYGRQVRAGLRRHGRRRRGRRARDVRQHVLHLQLVDVAPPLPPVHVMIEMSGSEGRVSVTTNRKQPVLQPYCSMPSSVNHRRSATRG